MSLQYAEVADVNRYLRANQKIMVGPSGQTNTDISISEIEAFLQDAEDKLNGLLNGGSINAGLARFIVIRWAAVDIYRALYPRSSVNEIPSAVLGWKEDADNILETVKQDLGGSIGAIGDWRDQL